MTTPAGIPTYLKITAVPSGNAFTVTPYSARGITQTLDPIIGLDSGNALGTVIRRDINGNLVDLTEDQFRKYESKITCNDQDTPTLDSAWKGQVVSVECAAELNYVTAGGTPGRTVVSGSSRTEGLFTYYRPSLTMMIIDIKYEFNEWGAVKSWTAQLQEV